MKAVMANVPEHILEWRRRTGADQWDEMWEGVLHMAPSPSLLQVCSWHSTMNVLIPELDGYAWHHTHPAGVSWKSKRNLEKTLSVPSQM